MTFEDKARFVALMTRTEPEARGLAAVRFIADLPSRAWHMDDVLTASAERTARQDAELRARGYAT